MSSDIEKPAPDILAKLDALSTELKNIIFHSENDDLNGLHPTTYAAALSLQAVTVFLDGLPQFSEQRLTVPLWLLQTALGDLEAGIQSPMLTKKRSEKGGAPPMATAMQMTFGQAAVALDCLIRFGKMKNSLAAKNVAQAMLKAGFVWKAANGGAPLHKAIVGWRNRLAEGPGGKAPPFALKVWQNYKSATDAEHSYLNPDDMLEILRSHIRESHILTNPLC